MMQEIKRFQVRGVPGEVTRVQFGLRTVDYWLPKGGTDRLLIAHDGQNVFDGRSSTHRGQTWQMAQSAIRVSRDLGIAPPVIIGIWHSGTKDNPLGRMKDLTPEKYIPAIAPGIPASQTAMIGSSMGGLATLYAVAQMPQSFTTALALSAHWPFGGNELVERTIKELPAPTTHKIWMSHGAKGLDSAYAPFQQLAVKLMHERGYRTNNFTSRVYPRSGHNERSWAKYLDQPLSFWLSETGEMDSK